MTANVEPDLFSTIELPLTVVNKHPQANCTGCPLYEHGTYVPSTFPVAKPANGNQLAFIGEAPGENEIKQGKPFIGLSGKVLNGVLAHYGIDRNAALMTNACSCHWPKEHFDKLPSVAVEHCRPRLLHELQHVGARTVVTLGAHGMRSVLKTKEGITLARAGGPRPSDYLEGILVVPTFHPAYAMRDHTVFHHIVNDLGKVNDGEWPAWEDIPYRVVRTVLEANHEIARLWKTNHEPLCVDTESGADKDETFGGAIKDVLCIGLKDGVTGEVIIFPADVFNDNNRKIMGMLFERNGLDGQNLKYDVARVLNVFLGVDGLLDIPIKGDRMLQSYVLDETSGVHGLDYMAREHIGAPPWKHLVKESMEEGRRKAKAEAKARKEKLGTRFNGLNYGFVDPEVLYRYNAYDVECTDRLRPFFDEYIMASPDFSKLYAHLIDVTNMLVHVEQRGMEIDLDYNAQLEVEYLELLDSIEFKGVDTENFNPRSVKQVTKFFNSIGFYPEDTKAGTLQALINRYSLTSERADVVDFCTTLLEHRGASKMMSTYVTGLRATLIDGIAHPDFGLLTVSGRSKARSPNAQNTPQGSKFRRQYVARKGKIYVSVDAAQAELRVMAWLARDETLRKMFMSPGDIFYDMCCAVYPNFPSYPDEKRSICRKLVKTIAYGTAYNRGPSAIATAFDMPIQEAQKIQAQFNAKIPDVIKYRNMIMQKALNREDLVTVFGRHRRFRLIVNQNRVDVGNEAAAHMPQSTWSDICLLAAVRADRAGLPIVNLVHDEIIIEPDRGDQDEAGNLLSKILVDTAEEVTDGYVPFKAGYKVGRSYGDFHD